jgi:MFS family permease
LDMSLLRRRGATGFSHTALVLLLSAFVYGITFRGMMPVLRQLYVLRLDYDPRLFGLWSAMGPLGFTTFSLVAGWLGVRLGECRTMLIGGLAMVAAMSLMPLPQVWPQARVTLPFVSNLAMSMSWTLINVSQVPALARACLPEQRAQAYAWLSALTGLGGFVGAYVGGVLPGWAAALWGLAPDSAEAYAAGLWVKVGAVLLCILPTLWVQLERPPRQPQHATGARVPAALIARTIGLCILAQAGVAAVIMFGTAYLDRGLHLPAAQIGAINSAGRLLAMVAALLSPWLAQRVGSGRGLLLVTAAIAVGLLPAVLSGGWLAAGFSVAVVLALDSAYRPMFSQYIMADTPEELRAPLSGINSVAYGLSFGGMTYGGGYVVAGLGYQALFLLGAVLSAVGVLAFAWVVMRERRLARAERAGQLHWD